MVSWDTDWLMLWRDIVPVRVGITQPYCTAICKLGYYVIFRLLVGTVRLGAV